MRACSPAFLGSFFLLQQLWILSFLFSQFLEADNILSNKSKSENILEMKLLLISTVIATLLTDLNAPSFWSDYWLIKEDGAIEKQWVRAFVQENIALNTPPAETSGARERGGRLVREKQKTFQFLIHRKEKFWSPTCSVSPRLLKVGQSQQVTIRPYVLTVQVWAPGLYWFLLNGMYLFPADVITNCCKLGGLRQQKLILSQF